MGVLVVCTALPFSSGATRMTLGLLAYAIVIVFLLEIITNKYTSVINPFSYFAVLYGLQTVFAPAAFYYSNVFDVWETPIIEKTILYSACYVLAVGTAFVIPIRVFDGAISLGLGH